MGPPPTPLGRRRRRRCGSRFREFSSSSFCVFEFGDGDPEKWKGEKNCAVVSVCCPNNMYTYGTDRDRHVCAESLAPAHEEKKSTHVSLLPCLRRECGLCDSLRRACLRREGVWGPNNGGENISGMSPPLPPPFSFWRMRVCVWGGERRVEEEFFSSSQKEKVGEKTAILSPSPKQELPALNPLPLLLAKVASQTKLTGNVCTIVHNRSMKDSLCTFILNIHGKLHCLPAQRGKKK